MTQKEEKKAIDELRSLRRAFDIMKDLDEENERWFNSSKNKIEYETELRLRHKEYRKNQI